ncbi:MAG: hypothetical protein J7480_05635, partial [Microbacteriaceae bacterium]|nr:hypothetical protein [Microbacteriaceae bacterium]
MSGAPIAVSTEAIAVGAPARRAFLRGPRGWTAAAVVLVVAAVLAIVLPIALRPPAVAASA